MRAKLIVLQACKYLHVNAQLLKLQVGQQIKPAVKVTYNLGILWDTLAPEKIGVLFLSPVWPTLGLFLSTWPLPRGVPNPTAAGLHGGDAWRGMQLLVELTALRALRDG